MENVDPNATIDLATKIINFLMVYGPWILVPIICQVIKAKVLFILVGWLKRWLSWIVPLFISALVWLIFSIGTFDIGAWARNVFLTWAIAAFGYDGAKLTIEAIKALRGLWRDRKNGKVGV